MAVSCSVIFDFAAMLDVDARWRSLLMFFLSSFDGVRLRGGGAVFAVRPAKQMPRRRVARAAGERAAC
jgi:hypothetical protein